MAILPDDRPRFQALAQQAASELENATAQEIIEWALQTFDDELCIASSMTDAVIIDMVSRIREGVHVVFLDTGYHFPGTLETLERVTAAYPVVIDVVRPRQTIAEQDSQFGPFLYSRDPDACCNLRKVEPLRRALAPYHAWVTGIRREEAVTRRWVGAVDWDSTRSLVKVNPLVRWTQRDVDDYIRDHQVITNPLLAQGYPSIGCAPCTWRVRDGDDPRSGRWAGTDKTECGLHFSPEVLRTVEREAQ